mgnify:CR=1 FL=1
MASPPAQQAVPHAMVPVDALRRDPTDALEKLVCHDYYDLPPWRWRFRFAHSLGIRSVQKPVTDYVNRLCLCAGFSVSEASFREFLQYRLTNSASAKMFEPVVFLL